MQAISCYIFFKRRYFCIFDQIVFDFDKRLVEQYFFGDFKGLYRNFLNKYEIDATMTEPLKSCSLTTLLDHPEFLEDEFWYLKNYDAGQLVILEGETGGEIYVILKGIVSVCTQVKVSEDCLIISGLCELFDGEEFAHSFYFDDEPHSAAVKTVSDCQLAVIDAAKLKIFLDDHPDIGFLVLFHWMKTILPRLRQSN